MLAFRFIRRRFGDAGTIANRCMCTILAFLMLEQLQVLD